jgi:hypothetical protein
MYGWLAVVIAFVAQSSSTTAAAAFGSLIQFFGR